MMWNGIKHNFILLNHCKPTTFELSIWVVEAPGAGIIDSAGQTGYNDEVMG